MKKIRYTLLCGAFFMTILSHSILMANGFNRIHEMAIPILIVLFSISFTLSAFLPAVILYIIQKIWLKGSKRASFGRIYLGALLGGEAGIIFCVLIWKFCTEPGVWDSYHYTLYPWIVTGLSFMGGCIAIMLGRRTRS